MHVGNYRVRVRLERVLMGFVPVVHVGSICLGRLATQPTKLAALRAGREYARDW